MSSAEACTASAGVGSFSSPSSEVSHRFTFATSSACVSPSNDRVGMVERVVLCGVTFDFRCDALLPPLLATAPGTMGVMPIRSAAALVVVVLTMLGTVATASAQTVPTAPTGPTVPPSIVEGRPETECISARARPTAPSEEFDRSSRSHLVLFGLLGLALVGIATRSSYGRRCATIVPGARRGITTLARAPAPSASAGAEVLRCACSRRYCPVGGAAAREPESRVCRLVSEVGVGAAGVRPCHRRGTVPAGVRPDSPWATAQRRLLSPAACPRSMHLSGIQGTCLAQEADETR